MLQLVDDVLRGRTVLGEHGARLAVARLVAAIAVCGGIYGLVMGTFGGVVGDRAWQPIYSCVKTPLLVLATFAICLPAFFVLNTLFGLRRDFADATRALAAAQACLAIVLMSLAPFTALWYASFADYGSGLRFNGAMFAVATFVAQAKLRTYYRQLARRDRRHRMMLGVWLVMYVFVGIQMAWIFRPFVGAPDQPVEFLRRESLTNAYVVVAGLVWQLFQP